MDLLTVVEHLSQGWVLVGFQAASEHPLTGPPRTRHHRSPEVADDHRSPFRDKLFADFPSYLGICSRVFDTPASVYLSTSACFLWALVFVHGWRSDKDNPRVMRKNRWMGEDRYKVLAVSLYRDELFASAAVVGGVIGAKEEGLKAC